MNKYNLIIDGGKIKSLNCEFAAPLAADHYIHYRNSRYRVAEIVHERCADGWVCNAILSTITDKF